MECVGDPLYTLAESTDKLVGHAVDVCIKEMRIAERRHAAQCRRVPSQCSLSVCDDQYLFIQSYENAQSTYVPFFESLRGKMQVFRLEGKDYDFPGDFLEIELGKDPSGTPFCVIVDLSKKYSDNSLYSLFLESGCTFYHGLTDKKIKTVLKYGLLSLHKKDHTKKKVKLLAGMDEDFIFHDGVTEDILCMWFPDKSLPLAEKKLERVTPDQDKFLNFLNDLQIQLKDWKKCVIMLAFLVLALFSTPIKSLFGNLDIFLNLIPEDNIPGEWIAQWLQIFNREHGLGVAPGTENRSKMMERLHKAGSEVIIYDNRKKIVESSYDKQKRERTESTLRDYVENGTLMANGRRFGGIISILSDGYINGRHVINLLLPESDSWDSVFHEKTKRRKCFESTVYEFVCAAEKRSAEIRPIIRKQREASDDPRVPLLAIAVELLDFLYENAGIDWRNMIGAPNVIDVRTLYVSESGSDEELVESFVSLLRKNASIYTGHEKRRGTAFDKTGIYYDNEWIYIPSVILTPLFVRVHRQNELDRTLRILRDTGRLLEGDSGRLYRKMQVSGTRKNYYVLNRSLLTPTGAADFVDLLKEEDYVHQ